MIRCYGLGGQNGGLFHRRGIANALQVDDLGAFIARYPDGCQYDEQGSDMRRFFKQRVDQRMAEQTRQRPQTQTERRRRQEEENRRREEQRRQQEQMEEERRKTRTT